MDNLDSARQASNNVATDARDSADIFRGWFTPKPRYSHPVPPSYCYQLQSDIMCFRDPQPGMERRLVGRQGADIDTTPIMVTQNAPVVTAPVVVHSAAAPRVTMSEPVYIPAAPTVKADSNVKN